MQTNRILYLLTVFLILTAVNSIKPLCFNCHCSTYELDNAISCKDAVTDKTSYFTHWTKNVSVVEKSDVVLATEVKSHTEKYCWCTDAKLEWNGLYQNSSGRLLTVHIVNSTKVETGHYWAVLYLTEKFYFSDPIYLNVTGPEEETPSPPLEVDPKMGALIVGVLFVSIMFTGIGIHCCKMHKRNVRQRKLKKERMRLGLEAESRIPLTHWELQHPNNTIQESDTEQGAQYGPEPRPGSDMEEEGSVPGKTDESSNSTQSLSSEEGKHGEEHAKEEVTVPAKTAAPARQDIPTTNKIHPTSPSPLIVVPIKDDRFRTERDWYKSLNTEVVSESLLSNKDREAKKEEKKRRKSMAAQQESSLAQGILKVGEGSGFMGPASHVAQDRIDRINDAYKILSQSKYKYGRSLPTPQPAGARPTVMGIFPGTVQPSHVRAGATIHISNPEKRRHVRTIFGDSGDPASMMRGRSRSVQFSTINITKRFNSADDLPEPKPKDKISLPKKSNLKNHRSNKNNVETDGYDPLEDFSNLNGSEPHLSSSGSSTSKETPPRGHDVKLDLTPASPVELNIEPPTPMGTNRFVVKQVDSDVEYDNPNPVHPADPLSKPHFWDFSGGSASSIEDCGKGSQRKMQHLTVPGMELPILLDNSTDVSRGYWSE
ncbi:hypothetical protein ACHWQZ_G012031 [Mnemiopsis leidyi]